MDYFCAEMLNKYPVALKIKTKYPHKIKVLKMKKCMKKNIMHS
jgi:hypothetical protein